MRDEFSQRTKSLLSTRVSFTCSNPECRHLTDGPAKGAIDTVSIGEAAHITAAAPGGPRYDATMTSGERASYENGIWLCRNCAAMIDRDELHYTVALLHKWKEDAEKEAEYALHRGLQRDESDQTEARLTDDEKIVLYYLLSKERLSVSREDFWQWCIEEEIYDVNYENAQLLLSVEPGRTEIQLEVSKFRHFLHQKSKILSDLKTALDNHKRLSSYTIRELWDRFRDIEQMLIAYSIEMNCRSLGDRWKAEEEIKKIKKWEQENGLDDKLSSGYGIALRTLIENEILYPTDWTSYGNARGYSFHKSAWDYLQGGCLSDEIEAVKAKHLKALY